MILSRSFVLSEVEGCSLMAQEKRDILWGKSPGRTALLSVRCRTEPRVVLAQTQIRNPRPETIALNPKP